MSLEREDSHWFMALVEHWGEQKGKAFFQQNPKSVLAIPTWLSSSPPARILFRPISIAKEWLRDSAAALDWLNLEPVIASSNVSALAKNAPHPHAALLFLDFIVDKESGQRIIKEANRIPTHPEVLPSPTRLREGFDFINVDPVKYNDKIDYYSKLWHEWFLQ
jgi:iron(III) transport system substrate-binding protein